MNPTAINKLLPNGYFATFVEAEDESVDSEFAIRNGIGDTGVAVQIGAGDFCVNRQEGSGDDFAVRFWPVRQWDATAALRKDLAEALG